MVHGKSVELFKLYGLSAGCIAKFRRYGVVFLTGNTLKARTLTAGDYGKLGKYGNYFESLSGQQVRKLTVIECCRLQTVPGDYFKVSSKSQCYKMLGNGWTVDVIAHLLGALLR